MFYCGIDVGKNKHAVVVLGTRPRAKNGLHD